MGGSTPAASGRIFLSYRRDEADYPAGWLYEHLVDRFGRDQVFKDVDSIELGDDFAEVLANAVGACDVLLALIGRQWLTITDEAGNRRLDDPNDFVRLEIEAALRRKVRVIPILIGNARMPRAEQVPTSLASLVGRQALELSPNRFESDTGRLLRAVDKTLAQAQAQREAKAKREADSKAKREAEARAAREAAAKAKQEAEAQADPDLTDLAGSRNDLGNRLSEVGKQPETRTEAPPTPEKVPAPSMRRAPKEAARRGDAGSDGTPSIPPVIVDAPAGPPPPSKRGKPPGKQRRPLSTRARILAGVGVVLILLLIIPIAVNMNRTPKPVGTISETPAPTGQVIFQDNFSRPTSGWNDAGDPSATGSYKNGAYRILLTSANTHVLRAPVKGASVYPSAPSRLRVDVTARMLGGGLDVGYGITCRTGRNVNSGYVFLMRPGYIEIGKTYDGPPYWKALWTVNLASLNVNVKTEYRLQAVCASDEGQKAVRLAFWVKGGRGLEVIDRDDPFPTGTVGLIVATSQNVHTVEAEFDDFVVRQV